MQKLIVPIAALCLVVAACSSSESIDDAAGTVDTPESTILDAAGAEASVEVLSPPLNPDETAVTVGPRALSRSELDMQFAQWAAAVEAVPGQTSPRTASGFTSEFAAFVLTQYIQVATIIDTVAEQGVEVTEAHRVSGAETIDAQLTGLPDDGSVYQLLVEGQAALAAVLPSDEQIEAHFEANRATFAALMCTSHILHETEADARLTVERIDQGEDFAALAREVSIGPSGPNGGDLGCVTAGSFVPEFEAAVLGSTEANEIVGPIETQFGFHIIQVHRVGEPSLGDVRDQIVQTLSEETNNLFISQLALAEVAVAADLGVWDSAQGRVVPPGS